MSILLVTYEHKTVGKDYTAFFDTLKSTPSKWWHYLESVWLVETTMTANDFARKLYPHITTTDRLLVIRVQREYQGWLTKEAWDWINKRQY